MVSGKNQKTIRSNYTKGNHQDPFEDSEADGEEKSIGNLIPIPINNIEEKYNAFTEKLDSISTF